MSKKIDCFMFFNELDLLEIRLNSLCPYVDQFIICESLVTHSGNPKPLYFMENSERFKGFNILHLVSDDGMTNDAGKNKGDAWRRENYQREYMMKAIRNFDGDDIVILSDLDEIPNLENYTVPLEGVFKQKLYYYYLNCFSLKNWYGSIASRVRNIPTLNHLRDRRNHIKPRLLDGGWHFAYLGDIRYKLESFAHQDLNTEEIKNRVMENKASLINPYSGNWIRKGKRSVYVSKTEFKIEMPSGPKWLLENKDKYRHLFKGEI